MLKTDDICVRYAPERVGITLKLLVDEEEEHAPMVLIEGGAAALRMLSELLAAVAEEKENDGFSISPSGAGKVHFSKKSEMGLYIHRLDE